MRRLARPTMAYGAAVAASGIALISAVEAWGRLQHPDSPNASFPALLSATLLGVALPLVAITAAIGLGWIARRLAGERVATGGPAQSDPPEPEPDHSAHRDSTWDRGRARAAGGRRRDGPPE